MEKNVKNKYVGIKATELTVLIIKNIDPKRKFTANLNTILSTLGPNISPSYLNRYYDMAEKLGLGRKVYTSILVDQLNVLRAIRDKFGLKNLVYAIDLVIAGYVDSCRYSSNSLCSVARQYIEKYESIIKPKPQPQEEKKRRFFGL